MFTKKVIYVCSYSDLETLFAEHFPELSDYCFVSDNEASNGSNHSFTVTGLEAADSLKAIQTDSSYNIALDALNVLCSRSVIKSGEYLVEVSW